MWARTRERLAPYLPWDATPREGPFWSRIPAHITYFAGTTLLLIIYVVAFGRRREAVPRWLYEIFVYEVSALTTDPLRAAINLVATAWLNTHPLQVVYVVILLGLFGLPFERREGTRRAILVFYGTSIAAAILGGLLLIGLRAAFEAAWIEEAWRQPWTGGSAGAFGFMGAAAARARRPWPLLVVFVVWEIGAEILHLRDYTAAFHFIALGVGFGITRFGLRSAAPRRDRTDDPVTA